MDARGIAWVIAFAGAGAVVGWTYCLLVRHAVARLDGEKVCLGRFAALMLGRLALLAIGFCAAACFGLWPLIAYLAGFFIMRAVVLSRARAEAIAQTKTDTD